MGQPVGQQFNASSGNVAAAVAAATIPAAIGKLACLAGIDVTAAGATAAAVVTLTITGVKGGPLSYTYAAPAGATLQGPTLQATFDPPLEASAQNVAIVVSLPSLGAGNTNATVNARGLYL
jgi:hypothetical protein